MVLRCNMCAALQHGALRCNMVLRCNMCAALQHIRPDRLQCEGGKDRKRDCSAVQKRRVRVRKAVEVGREFDPPVTPDKDCLRFEWPSDYYARCNAAVFVVEVPQSRVQCINESIVRPAAAKIADRQLQYRHDCAAMLCTVVPHIGTMFSVLQYSARCCNSACVACFSAVWRTAAEAAHRCAAIRRRTTPRRRASGRGTETAADGARLRHRSRGLQQVGTPV